MKIPELLTLLKTALQTRSTTYTDQTALRLFNGFTEGFPALSVERYADTLVLLNNADEPELLDGLLPAIIEFYLSNTPGINCILVKDRRAHDPEQRRGRFLYGNDPAKQVYENGIIYAIDLTINQDTSFYMDTRNLRVWAKENLNGKLVLNTFAYTGSLGVAALSGGATRTVQTDLNKRFLNIAKRSAELNGLPDTKKDYIAGDFFSVMARFRNQKILFDCIFLDPPFFSTTAKGRVDLLTQHRQLINKVRPLVAHEGWLVTINNALFLSGAEYMSSLEQLCADGYLNIEQIIPIPTDCTGFGEATYPTDPTPFIHPTKIVILKAKRKDERKPAPYPNV